MRCSRTGREYPEFSDGIWDDGEWIGWDWINQQISERELRAQYPHADPALMDIFERLVEAAADNKAMTGKCLQIWGELGELFAEVRFGIRRHRSSVQGSDGKLGNDFIEVKTIPPEKSAQRVHVKRAGHFTKVLVVKINEGFGFERRLIERSALGKGAGKRARVSWSSTKEPPTDGSGA